MILIQSHFANDTVTREYTNNTGGNVIIDKIIARNNDASSQALSIYIVPSGGSVDTSNLMLTVTIPAAETERCEEVVGISLGPNDSMWVLAGLADSIAIRSSGRTQ